MKVSAKKTCTFQIIVLLFSSESVKVSTNNTNTFQAFSHKGPRQLFPKCGNLFIGFCSCSLKRITAFNGNNFWKAMLTFCRIWEWINFWIRYFVICVPKQSYLGEWIYIWIKYAVPTYQPCCDGSFLHICRHLIPKSIIMTMMTWWWWWWWWLCEWWWWLPKVLARSEACSRMSKNPKDVSLRRPHVLNWKKIRILLITS